MTSRRGQEGSHDVEGSGSVASDAPFQVPRDSISGSIAPEEMDMLEPPKGWYNVGFKELLDMLARWERRRSAQVPYAGYDGSISSDGLQLTTPYLLNRLCWPNAERLTDLRSSPAYTAPAFAPVTPDKQGGSREGRHHGNAGSSDGGETSREGQHQTSVCSTVNPEEKDAPIWFNFDQRATWQTYISSTDIPMQLEEKIQEKAEGVDLNKTPTQKPRRKKHRPKVVSEGKRSRTPKPLTSKPVTSKPAETEESAGGKRKHARRKGINSPVEHPSDVIRGESTEIYAKRTRSVRRRLDFSDKASEIRCQATNCVEQAKVMSTRKSNCQPSSKNGTCSGTKTTSALKGKHEAGINSSACISLALSASNNQVLDGYLNSLDIPSLPLQPSRRELIRENLKKLARLRGIRQVPDNESTTWSGKNGCQSVLGNAPTPTSTAKMMSRDENVRTGQNMENNNLSYSAMLHGVNAIQGGFKYAHNLNPTKPNGSSVALIYANQSPPFPQAPKKRRTQKRKNGVALSEVVSTADTQRILESARLRYMEGKQACRQREKMRSNVPSQSCNATLTDDIRNDYLPGGSETLQPMNEGLNNDCVHEPQACVKALMADALAKVTRKRRTRKEKTKGLDITGCQDTGGLYIDITSSNQKDIVIDILVKKLEHLDIKTDKQNKVQESYAIVPYGTHGMIVSFSGQLDPRKKFRPRAKVDLDQETSRVWKLLMGKESLDRIEGTGVDKEKWWEEERRVFRGRADSFIAKMHLVQGDRRFSPWKGSVLDSVIGVFLTQNVSDHLSSSAFMALAARFPRNSKKKFSIDLNSSACMDLAAQFPRDSDKCKETNCDEVSTLMRKPAVCMVDLNSSDPSACVHSQVAAQAVSEMEEKEKHPSWKNIKESKSDSVSLAITNSLILGSSFSHLELLEIAGSPMFRELYAVRTTNSEIESSNLPFGNVLKHGLSVTEEGPLLSSVFSDQFTSLGTRDHLSEEHPCQVYEHGNSLLAPQRVSSRNSQEVTVNHGQHLAGVNTNTCYGLQDQRTMETKRKLRCSDLCSRSFQIDSEVLHETKMCTHEGHSSSYLMGTSGIAACIEMEKEKHLADNNNKENPKQGSLSSIKHPVASSEPRTRRAKSEKDKSYDWESLRREVSQSGAENERSPDTMDSLDWEEVRNADVNEISNTIRERGMNNMLAERIKSFLDRLVKDHGSINLEWLRDIPPDKAKDYLLSIRGLGLKSVECVRLLTLHHLAFPVDTNVGRICVRLGWVPLQPLPESLQLHLLELYPMLETIQKYLWPRLCTLDQRTLYELHYQMITFGKVFCTKNKPNCNACPMRGECKHFASAFASARLALPGPEDKSLVNTTMDSHKIVTSSLPPLQIEGDPSLTQVHVQSNLQPIIEEPSTPELECTPFLDVPDIEECFFEDADEIPTIKLNATEFAQNLQNYMQYNNMDLQNVDWSKALVALTPEAASIPMPKLKNVNRLRTEHRVYELPDSHPLLEGLDKREPQDPCPYLLAIWTPGETAESTEPPESCCNAHVSGSLCDKATCFACNSLREAQAQMVRGTILIPCRTAMRGSFPLNGTYFQVNEVFADHESSLTPIDVPRALIWNLPRRIVYFGTSIPAIFRGLTIEDIQNCFWRGFVCVRGFDRNTRGPRPLMARLHFPVSKINRGKKAVVKDVA